MNLALANRALDAAVNNEPWATQLEQAGVLRKVATAADVDPYGNVAGVLFSEPFARNTPAARNYLLALLRGVRDYWDAYDGRLDFQRVIDALAKYTPLKDERLIRKIPPPARTRPATSTWRGCQPTRTGSPSAAWSRARRRSRRSSTTASSTTPTPSSAPTSRWSTRAARAERGQRRAYPSPTRALPHAPPRGV